jgi:hypothetical protein
VTTRDEALERARSWAGGAEVGIHEFDLGYVVWAVEPEPVGDRPPATVGTARGVIDRATGELTLWPALPPEAVAQEYRRARTAADRFPSDVREKLRLAGWHPGRSVPDEVARFAFYMQTLDVALFGAAEAILREFGGLRIENGNKFSFAFHPAEPTPEEEDFAGLGELLGKPVYPVGVREDDGPSHLVVDDDGRLFLHHWAGNFYLAPTVDEAIIALVRGVGNELPKVRSDGTIAG